MHSGRVSVSMFRHLAGHLWRPNNICVRRLRRFQHSPASLSSPASPPAFSKHPTTLRNALYKWFYIAPVFIRWFEGCQYCLLKISCNEENHLIRDCIPLVSLLTPAHCQRCEFYLNFYMVFKGGASIKALTK